MIKEYVYFCSMEKAIQQIEDYIEKRELTKALDKIAETKSNLGTNTSLLYLEANCYELKELFGKAINVYNEILTLDANEEIAEVKKEQIQTILNFTNIDIYANPNLNLDPWD